ncbi:MAG: DUF1016 N-terminal domain-containing protein [Clostridium sp.]
MGKEYIKEVANVNNIYFEISNVINQSKNRIAIAINSEMIILHWTIGKIIKIEILKDERAEYGKAIVAELSKELTNNYGKGYSRRNLFNMISFYETIPEFQIVQTLSAQLSWSHLLKLITILDPLA